MGKILIVNFIIPKNRIKNANTPMNYIVSANKSAWIREYAEEIWTEAIKNQFNITAIEPVKKEIKLDLETQENLNRLNELEAEVNEVNDLLKTHISNDLEYKEAKKSIRLKNTSEIIKSKNKEKIDEYEETLTKLKTLKQRRTLTLRNFKKMQSTEIKKAIRKAEAKNKKEYVKEKIKINEFQHLFKQCHITVTINNITNRDFDAPNFAPTSKNLIDAGTDTGILWEDDNNNIIKSMTFLAGNNVDRNNYHIDINVYEDINDMTKALEGYSG